MSNYFDIDQENVDPKAMREHIIAYLITTEVLRAHAQPIRLLAANKHGLAFGLRLNLDQRQAERLIVREAQANLIGYDIAVDWKTREMRVMNADQAGDKKPARTRKKAAAGRDAAVSEVI